MNKCITGSLLALLLVACSSSAKQSELSSVTERDLADSLAQKDDEEWSDSTDELSSEMLMQVLFEEFAFNFFQNKQLQKRSIRFPLSYTKDGNTSTKTSKEWKGEDLIAARDYYTVIFDRDEQMELEHDSTIVKIFVDWCYLNKQSKRRYEFVKERGTWLLVGIEDFENGVDVNSDFLSFYHRFSTDSVFQYNHLAESIDVVTTDPNDEFEVVTGTIEREQWELFRPELPKDTLTTIDYGQHATESDTKVIVKKGFSNGMLEILRFKKMNGTWRLVSFES